MSEPQPPSLSELLAPPSGERTPEPPHALEPPRPSAPARPSGMRALARGCAKRCPRCGGGGLFRRWIKIAERCPTCGLPLEREEGGFLGAMSINYTVTAGVWLVVLVVWLVLDLPDVRVAPLLLTSLVVAGLVPLLFYPFSKTIWAAIDYLAFGSSGSSD